MFQLKFLPATIGDSIWISYGDEGAPHHILVDGGTDGTRLHIERELTTLDESDRRIELMVISHIDKDHIGGILKLLQRSEVEFEVGDIWFNGLQHLPESDDDFLGAVQGEALTKALTDQQLPWNRAFKSAALGAVALKANGQLPQIDLPGGMRITLLSPTLEALAELRSVWIDEITDAGLLGGAPAEDAEELPEFDDNQLLGERLTIPNIESLADSDFRGDRSEANGSSIALLAEFDGKRVLLGADAHAPVLADSIRRLSPNGRLQLDLFKISHHGSQGTTDRELLSLVESPKFAISTNGSIFGHPDPETLARILVERTGPTELSFNYRTTHNQVWDRPNLKEEFEYQTLYPAAGESGIEIEL